MMQSGQKRPDYGIRRLAAVLLPVLLLSVSLLCACTGKPSGTGGGTGTEGAPGGSPAAAAEPETFAADPEDTSTFTLLVYMIGSDLESLGGSATDDLREMLAAQHSDRLRIAVQTGGAAAWTSDLTGRDNGCRRFLLDDELELKEELGVINMSEPAALTDFIRFASEECPADRYGLILWNHGAGTLMGYGMDENYEDIMLEIGDLRKGVADSGIHFYFVGFDACLMSTVEVAAALEEHADYLIASEETEPSGGWSYTPFLSQLSARPGIDMREIAPRIVDDFVNDPTSTKYDNNTLAVLDLSKLPAVQSAVSGYLESIREHLAESYDILSLSRSRTRSYGGGLYEQVDLLDLMEQLPVYLSDPAAGGSAPPDLTGIESAADAVRKALKEMTVYTRSMDARSSGLAVYFPYLLPDRYDGVAESMREIGYGDEYFRFFEGFLNYVVAEQERADVQPVAANIRTAPWYRPEDVELKEETYIDPSTLVVKEGTGFKGDMKYIDMEGEQWKLIEQLENVIYVDTEEYGRLELGCRNLQHIITSTGDPYYDFDGKWIALNDRIVPYYEAFYTLNEEEDPYSYGFIPAELNGREISIVIWFSLKGVEEVYIPEVIGYRREPVMSFSRRSSVIDISAGLMPPDKGVHPFREGDEILLYAYREDGSKAYPYDLPIIYHENEGLYVLEEQAVETFAGGRFTSLFQQIALRDIFNNTYLCEGTALSYEWQEQALRPEVNSPGLGPGPDSWNGPTEKYRLTWDYDNTLAYPSDIFEEKEDWDLGDPDLVSRDGRVQIFLKPFSFPDDYASEERKEFHFALFHEYSLENYTLANGMTGQRYLYHEDDGRWFCGQLAGSSRMRGGIYGFGMEVWCDGDPDEELRDAIFYIGNSLLIE